MRIPVLRVFDYYCEVYDVNGNIHENTRITGIWLVYEFLADNFGYKMRIPVLRVFDLV